MIAKIDELDNPESLTELWRGAMPMISLSDITQAHYLNELESQVSEIGWEALRHLMVEQWRLSDGLLVEEFRREQAGAVAGDGYSLLKVASRGLQEWVCLLPGDLPFGAVERLLGWMAHEPEVMSETQVRRWVCRHGELIRQAEQAEVEKLGMVH
ncbi:MAG: hypothetical protein ACOYYU_17115 [Chloroflexota bacterium]